MKRAFRLALVTVFQFMEGLTDRQAADAVRDRLAWKYALSLELTDPGFDHTVLSEFRSRMPEGHAEQRLLDLLMERCREAGWLKAHGRHRDLLDPCAGQEPRPRPQPHAVRGSDHGLCVERADREVTPDWVRAHVPVEWVEHYGERLYHFSPTLKTHWYQAETGYDLTHFDIDWEAETVTCPQGRSSSSWTPVQDAGKPLLLI